MEAGTGPGSARIDLCGPFGVSIEGKRLEHVLPRGRPLVLFAYLALNRDRAVPRGELLDALWPSDPPADPDASLRTLISRVRTALGSDRLEGRSELRLVLPDGAWIDVEAAADAVAQAENALKRSEWLAALAPASLALELAERPLLPGIEAPWVELRRLDLEDIGHRALKAVATIGLELGGQELAAAERAARRLVKRSPFRESGHRLLIEALARLGNQAEALRAYENVRLLLREELGTTPTSELQELHDRLLRGEIAALAPADQPTEERTRSGGLTAQQDRLETAPGLASSGRMEVRVLIADDQELIRDGLRTVLERQPGIEVVGEAGTGAEAVALAASLRPDVILMDIRMPELDGIEATRQIVNGSEAPPRVVILTTFDLDEYVFEALRAGASGFLLKDARREKLVHAVEVAAAGDALLSPSVTRRLIEAFVDPGSGGTGEPPAGLDELTSREVEVLGLIGGGLSDAEIAERLVVAEKTVKTHIGRIFLKLGLRDRAQAVVLSYESGLVRPAAS